MINIKNYFTLLISSLALSLASSCNLKPEYKKPEPEIINNWSDFEETNFNKQGQEKISQLSYEKFFKNKELQNLIAIALKNNKDLRLVILNIKSAKEFYAIKKADLLPQISADASFSRQRTPSASLIGFGGNFASNSSAFLINNYRANLASASYEFDFFKRLENINDAAFQDFLSKIENRNSVKISLISEVANAYLQYISDIEKMKIAKKRVEIEEKNLNLAQNKYKIGVLTKQDLLTAKKNFEIAKYQNNNLEKIVKNDKNYLKSLLSYKNDLRIEKIKLDEFKIIENLPQNLPSEVILLRPDVKQAEFDLKSKNANIGAARAAFFPSISLTGSYGFASVDFSDLFSSSGKGAWSFSPQINIPIFQAGKLNAQLKVAKIDKEIAIQTYQKKIQNAFKEIYDELSRQEFLKKELKSYELASSYDSETLKIDEKSVEIGSKSSIDIISSKRNYLTSRNLEIEAKRQYLMNKIDLFKVLGGGLDNKISQVNPNDRSSQNISNFTNKN